jgi:uncharacterized protein (DUF924 family)
VASSEEVLAFWFGAAGQAEQPAQDRMQLWFQGGAEVDREIRERFGADLARARRGELNAWAETPRGRLALIILLDQFSRNVYRGSGDAFASDALSLQLTLDGLDRGQDQALSCVEQLFFVLPLEHAEDLPMQERMVSYVNAWAKNLPEALQGMAQGVRDFAQLHREVIARFGRFPTRNAALGRRSTPEEEAHVREAKSAGRPV